MNCPLHKIELVPKGVHILGCPKCDHIQYIDKTFPNFPYTQNPRN